MGKSSTPQTRFLPKGLVILYEDDELLVVNKPAGLLTIATDNEKTRTAYFALTDYVRKGAAKSRKRIFIVHRLDREASGLLVFARTAEAKRRLQDGWTEAEKRYLAVVHGKPEKDADTIESYLAENKARVVYSTSDRVNGKLSRTAFRTLKATKLYSLLEVNLLTGRKHQIRVHLAGIGHPIVGDKKYGSGKEAHARLALHAHSLSFHHPVSGKLMNFETPAPDYFVNLVGRVPGATEGSTEKSRQRRD